MKATEQYFPVVPFIMLYKVVLPFESLDEIVKRDHSNAYSKRQSVLPTTESSGHSSRATIVTLDMSLWRTKLTSCVFQPVLTAVVPEFSWLFVQCTALHPLVKAA